MPARPDEAQRAGRRRLLDPVQCRAGGEELSRLYYRWRHRRIVNDPHLAGDLNLDSNA